jgi:hypothetical protein
MIALDQILEAVMVRETSRSRLAFDGQELSAISGKRSIEMGLLSSLPLSICLELMT